MKRKFQIHSLDAFTLQEVEPGFVFPGGAHPAPELLYVDQGSLHSVADGRDLTLQQGDFVFYPPNQWHMQYADMGIAPRFLTIVFQAEGADFSGLADRIFHASPTALELLRQMRQEQDHPDAYTQDMLLTCLELLMLQLLRTSHAPARKLTTAYALHSENEIIRRAQQYVSAHLREKLSVPLVARKVDVSPSYLTALFHKHLDISPGEYIRRVKLQESKRLIREGRMNFTEIAAALQYSTVHHFSRQFKEKFGITPTEYAKSVR